MITQPTRFARIILAGIAMLVVSGAMAAQPRQDEVWMPPLSSYPWPESAVAEFIKEIGQSSPGKSPRLDKQAIRLATLYLQLGRYDEAGTALFPFWSGTSRNDEVKAVAAVFWPLLWSDIGRDKGERLDSINQLGIAGIQLEAIKSPAQWAELARIIKAQRFVQLLELVPLADQMDRAWNSETDRNAYPQNESLTLLLALRPQAARLEQGHVSVATEQLEGLGGLRPWKDTLLLTAEVLTGELRDLDRAVLGINELANAWHSAREGALLSARGNPQEAVSLRRTAAGTFRLLQQPDALMEVLAGMTTDRMAIGTPESLLAAKADSDALIALHEERMARMGSAGSRYQVRHAGDYRNHLELLRRLLKHADTLQGSGDGLVRAIRQELVLHADRLQLRPARRQMAMLRAVASEPLRTQLKSDVARAKPALAAAAKALAKAQVEERISRDDLRSGEKQHMLKTLRRAKRGGTIRFEAGEVSSGKPMSAEGGVYTELWAAQQAIRSPLETMGAKSIGASGRAVELPEDWDGLRAGMASGEAIVVFLEFGQDQALWAAVITDANEPRIVELPGATLREVHGLVVSVIDALATNTSGQSAALGDLARILWHPLGSLPQRLTIVPNLSLIGLPFEALPTRDGRPVVEEHTIRYALGLDDGIGHFAEDQAYAGALVIGAEEFSRLRQLKPMAESRQEVDAIRTLMSQAKIWVTPQQSLPRTGADLLLPSAGVDIIHVSTHTELDAADPLFDRLVFPADDILPIDLALSPLRAKIAVLSACNLLRNRKKGKDPVSGLATASLAVIAPHVVGTLWSVESRPTRIFMSAFYEKLLQLREPARALAETKRLFRDSSRLQAWASEHALEIADARELSAAHYWAGFALMVRSDERK